MPTIHWNDVAEIAILTFVAYHILVWIKNTRAWALLKGVIVILIFIVIAALCKMNTILWIVPNIISIAATAFVVVLQPELRAALEELGRKNFLASLLDSNKREDGRFSDRTVNEIVKACVEMGKVKTGALIVIEHEPGTRHRAGVGISEVTDSLTVIVSEETGKISVAYGGALERGLDASRLKERIFEIQDKPVEEKKRKLWKSKSIGKAGVKDEE